MFDKENSGRGFKEGEALNAELGMAGFDRIGDTSSHDGEWFAIKAIGGTAELDSATCYQHDDLADGDTILEGDIIFGRFTEIQLASGTVLAYKATDGFLNID